MAPRLPFLSQSIKGITKGLEKELRAVGQADSRELRDSAAVMKKAFRTLLSVKGSPTTRSRPGEPPRKQTGALAGSVRDGIVGGGRRVAVTRFTAAFQEGGIDTTVRRGKAVRKGRQASTPKARRLVIGARPFRGKAIALAADGMRDVIVRGAGDRLDAL